MPRTSAEEIERIAKRVKGDSVEALRWLARRAGKAMPKGSGAPKQAALDRLADAFTPPLCRIYATGEVAITPTGRAVFAAVPPPARPKPAKAAAPPKRANGRKAPAAALAGSEAAS